MASVVGVAASCGPGRGAGGRLSRAHKLKPLVFKQHVPNVSENTVGASGAAEGRITADDHQRFSKLIPNYNADIIYKDEEGTGADLLMTQRCKDRLNTLAISVMNQWPGVRLRVIEGWDQETMHSSSDNLHYEGRAVDVTTSDRDRSKYGMLAKLAVEAGFDWVYYEARSHIHCSVKSESSSAGRASGCFPSNATILTPTGPIPMSQVRVGDLVETSSGSFSPVLSFLDRDPSEQRLFVQVHTRTGRVLELTPQHLLPVSSAVPEHLTNSYRRLIFAAKVQIGDFVEGPDGQLDEVVDVRTSQSRGVFAPLTAEGTLVVNNVSVSCYAVVNSHELAHAALAPYRLLLNMQQGLQRLWRTVATPLMVVSVGESAKSEPVVGVHWYADWLYSIAEYVLPGDMLYQD